MLKKIIFVLVIFSFFIYGNIFAATKEDVIIAINKTYLVGEEQFRLPQEIITKGENYLNKNPLTSKQYDNILRCIDNAYALALEMGTTDISKYSKEDINRVLTILIEASDSANIDLNKELNESNISIPINSNNSEIKTDNLKDKNQNDKELSNDVLLDNGEILSNISQENVSGEIIYSDFSSEEYINSGENLLQDISNIVESSNEEDIDFIIDKKINIFTVCLFIFLLLNILLLCLILKAKWNRIIKCILVIIFVILIITVLGVLVLLANYIEELKLIYKIYYMF